MSGFSIITATCHSDNELAVTACVRLEAIAEAVETFRDKPAANALRDLHMAMLDWEELHEGISPEENVDLMVHVETDPNVWDIDINDQAWMIDLRMSIFHGRLMFVHNTQLQDA